MSTRRIGPLAAVVGLGVLASLAFTATPSWAAKAGNSANAALCEPGGYPGVLLAQDGSAFKNAGQCTSYGAHGGKIAGVNMVAGLVSGGMFTATYSGFGLKPNSPVFLGVRYQPSGFSSGTLLVEEVGGNGTFSAEESLACERAALGKVGSMVVAAETAAGAVFVRAFPPPSGC
jgi:hypothetical protein